MDVLKNIFGIDLDVDLYIRSANSTVPIHLANKIKKRCEENSLAVAKFEEDDVYVPKIFDMEDIKRRFKKYCIDPESVEFSSMELKKMSYFADDIATSQDEFLHLITLYSDEDNWRDSYINGFIYFLLSKWDVLEYEPTIKTFKEFIIDKIASYDGTKQRLLRAKDGVQYLAEGGATKLGQRIKSDGARVINAPQYLGQKDSALVFPFFSKVIQAFYYKDYLNYDDLDDVLTIHSSLQSSKLVLADKINYINRNNKTKEIDKVKSLALEHIGDPATKAKWGTSGLDEDSAAKVDKAHENINRWMIQMYIDVVFSTIIEDPRRREFWLEYVDYISSFKVIGSPLNRQKLASNPLLSDSLKYYFKQTTDERTKATCSMLIAIKDHYFIEFSDLGALYVYETSNPRISKLLKGNISKIEDLKTSDYNNLVEPGYYYDSQNNEGKMVHRGTWESRLTSWFKNKLEIDATQRVHRRRG